MQPAWEVAHVLGRLGDGIEDLGLNGWQLRTLRAIQHCRTSVMGGHRDACDACGNIIISYNSCRNRHCPKCQGHKREEWIQAREADLLPVPYFHVVFTLPDALNELALHKPKEVYDALFVAAWQTLATFGKNKGLQMGMISVLHTWVGPPMRSEFEFTSSFTLYCARPWCGCKGSLAEYSSRW